MATNSAITPMPPSQLVSPRQKKTACPYAEKSRNTVAPVVVRPDIDSNSASIWPRPFHMYGRPANHAISSQAMDTIARPSTRRMPSTASSAALPAGAPHQVADRGGHDGRDAETDRVEILAVDQRHRERGQEHQAEHADHETGDVND